MVEPGGKRLLVDTGNATWDGRRYFGDSVLELTLPGLHLRQSYTPKNQAELNSNDLDLGSSAPALLGEDRVLVVGQGRRHAGARPGAPRRARARRQAAARRRSADAAKRPATRSSSPPPRSGTTASETTVFVADFSATAAYALRGGRLHKLWQNDTPGTSPIVAGGLVYVYEPSAGGIEVYRPGSSKPIAKLPGVAGPLEQPDRRRRARDRARG